MGLGRGWRRVLGLGVLAAMVAACHEPRQTQPVQAAAVIDREALDFGEVPVGEWRDADVLIRNVGVVPFFALEALALEGNPSYQVELLDGESRVMPGDSKVVRVRFHPLREGAIEERLRVRTDANTGAENTVTVRGMGGPTPVGIHPPVLDFETLEVDSDRTLTLTITNPVDLPLTVTVGGDKADPFSTDVVTIPPHSTQQVATKYLPRELGRMGARVEVRACEGCTPATAQLAGHSVESAFVFEPTPVYFAPIPVHERTDSKARARNITWRPVTISSLATSDQGFSPKSTLDGRQVGPGDAVPLELEFAARSSGPLVAELTVNYTSDRDRQSKVLMDARGGRPTLAVTPMMLDFGELPVGGKVAKVVRIANAGSNGKLGFLSVRGDGASGEFNVDVPTRGTQPYPWAGGTWPSLEAGGITIDPGNDAIELKVYFEPKAEGNHQATLTLVSDDPFTPERTLVLTGRARTSGPCVYVLKPQPVMDFGNVAPGRTAVLGFRFENPGRAECAVKDIHISNDAGGAFLMPGGRITGGVLLYDTAFSAMVAFRPPAAGSFTGELKLTVNNPANPTVTLPLKGISQTSCLVATPAFVDFGPIRYDCSPRSRSTLIANQCPHPITVESARIGEGTSNQFQLMTPLTGPRTLQPGEGFELEFTYARNVLGQHFSPFYLQAAGEPHPFLVPLLAETNHEGVQLDNFVQGTDSQLDVLFVVSNTTTMAPYQQKLRDALPGWLAHAQREGVDVRVGVTSTGLGARYAQDGRNICEGDGGRLLPLNSSRPRIVGGTAVNAAQTLQDNVGVGLCHNLVQGLETTRQALSSPLVDSQDDPRTPQSNDGNLGLLRPTARLAVVALADEDDHSGFPTDSYTQFLQSIKGPGMSHRTQFYALVPTDSRCTTAGGPGERFSAVARSTGGAVESVCQGNYQPFLERLIFRAGDPQADFPLSATPDGVSYMAVRVQGRTVDPTLWRYDAARNAIVFQPTAVPSTGQSIQIRYRSVCRNP